MSVNLLLFLTNEYFRIGMVEYQYDPDGPWRLAKISFEPLEAYKASKFALWKGMLDKPSCIYYT